jgi:lipopolysaccharide biosynthesis glycosyltransferase
VFGHISIATYFRLLLPSILPPLLERVLFIDSDIVINSSLEEFRTTPIDGYAMAAATDRNLDTQRKRLGLAPDSPYFNGQGPPWMTSRFVVACCSDQPRRSVVCCLKALQTDRQLLLFPWDQWVMGHGVDRLDESDEQHAGPLAQGQLE